MILSIADLVAVLNCSLEQPLEGASSSRCEAGQVGLLSLLFVCIVPVIDPRECGISDSRCLEIGLLPRIWPVLAVMLDPFVLEE